MSHDLRAPPGRRAARRSRGALVTLAVVLVVEALATIGLVPAPSTSSVAALLLLGAVIHAAITGGVVSGLISAAIGVLYFAYIVVLPPGQPLRLTREAVRGIMVILVALPSVGAVVGLLRDRLDQALARERERQRALEQAAAELQETVDALRSRTEEAEAARAGLEASEWHARFLAEASRLLVASLDYDTTLQTVARLAASTLADWCVVDVAQNGDEVRRLAVAHADPAKQPLVEGLQRYPSDRAEPEPLGNVLRTGRPALIPEIAEAQLAAAAQDAEHLRLLRQLEPRSMMVVPLLARGRTLGAIKFVRTAASRPYTHHDLDLAEDLAHRAALAADNARLYREANQASQAKSDFLGVMSHELRTPLNAILGYTDLLAAGLMGPLTDDQREKLGRLKANAQHLLDLIEEILGFAGVQAGRQGVAVTPADLGDIAKRAAATIEPLARDKGLRFVVDLPEGPAPVELDPGKVRQMLLHLLSNAVKFTERGEVRLRAGLEDDTAVLVVRDTGIGIPQEALERIFEPFWQLEQSATRRVGGTGLGLSLARQLARLLGGDITVKSTLGKGSTFTARLPAKLPRPRGRAAEDAAA